MPTFNQLLSRPAVQSVLLLEILAAVPLAAWIYTGANSIYKHALPDNVTLATFTADESAVTEAATLAELDSTAGRWFQSGAFVYWRAASGSVFDYETVGMAEFFFSDAPKFMEGNFYDPRLKSVPKLSLRIEDRFGSVTQIGGGNLVFENADAFFDGLAGKVRWDNGTATLKLGLDTGEQAMYYFDYRTIGTWSLDGGAMDDANFSLAVRERKQNLSLKIPSEIFSNDDFPYLDPKLAGKTIPKIYGRVHGAKAFVVNPNTNTLKVCSNAIDGFIGLRKKESRDRTETMTLGWFPVIGTNYYRTAFSGDVLSVTCNSTTMTKVDTLDDVDAAASRFTTRDNFIYLRPPGGITPDASNTSFDVKISNEVWVGIDFASRDTASGEFTVSSNDWDGSAELSVDVIEGTENAADVVAAILALVGETNLDTAAFDAARAWFDLGTDHRGAGLTHMRVSLYLMESQDALEAIRKVLAVTGAYLYVNAAGQWVFKAAAPSPSDATDLTDLELLQIKRSEDATDIPTQIQVNFAKRSQDGFSETLIEASEPLRIRRGLAAHNTRVIEAALWREQDARYLAQQLLSMEGQPLTKFEMQLPRLAMVIAPGDNVRVRRERGTTDEFMEVLEMNFDLASKQCALTLGDMRGWGRSCGFWMPSTAAAWDDGMTDEAARTAAQGGGYWTDANGFADAGDARSHLVSRWW